MVLSPSGLIVRKAVGIMKGGSKSFQVDCTINRKRCLKVLWDELLRQGDEGQIC